jgi:hypothetical protein
MENLYSVAIETWGAGIDSLEDEAIVEVASMLNELGAEGAATSVGGLAGGIGATFGVVDPEHGLREPGDTLAEVTRRAVNVFVTACEKAGVPFTGIASLEVTEDRYVDLQLETEPERDVGTAEVAEFLGVSKQRVSELRSADRMPAPVAELRSGPVWAVSSLQRFVDGWDRRPGRRRRVSPEEGDGPERPSGTPQPTSC